MRNFIRISAVFLGLSIFPARAMNWFYCCCYKKKSSREFVPIKFLENPLVTFPGKKLHLIEVPAHRILGYDREIYDVRPQKLPENSKKTEDYLKDFTKIILSFNKINAKKRDSASLRLIEAELIATTIDSISNDQTKILPEIVYNFFDAVKTSLPYYKSNENLLKDPKQLPETDNPFWFSTKTQLTQEYKETEKKYEQLKKSLEQRLKTELFTS